ncbi:MAG: hypothetical protein LKJ29_01860 [Lactobacillus sp.]|uniref:Transposase n=1 Tax=Lacticaseibacillus suilingensis TaxID=2799577 RepID=A0ABW4BDV4_9LACO|nr:hypothetical protein [Lacticaseibacillus suilingensis]MCI1894962.1 hypothetical protein [Lactobacillus sp.]MCI1940777.1 hypothetical protein [Lactobacillus sp.]MCI1971463.1 hypothetical protein [Lactobacillus sp.]MCI2038410.1 hypothetical protein [Lactobacillus sp.]
MLTTEYIQCVNQELERLLVFETVFKEYAHTCRNIEKGNCLASESFSNIRLYFSKNIIRFDRFVQQCAKVTAPSGYERFNNTLIDGLKGIRKAVLAILGAIEPDHMDHEQFEDGLEAQKAARAEIDHAFEEINVPAF